MEPIDPRTVRSRPAPRLQWRKPPPLDGAVALVERGAESEQRRIQAERQRSVLPHIYFSLARYVVFHGIITAVSPTARGD